MSSYYGDRSRDVPSWESLEVGDDDEVVDTSEVSSTLILTPLTTVSICIKRSYPLLCRCLELYADPLP